MTLNKYIRLAFLPTVFLFLQQPIQAQQQTDTLKVSAAIKDSTALKVTADDTVSVVKKRHSPAKAALYSGLLPGLGQAYNKKYWKIPIVYGGFAGLGFWIGKNVKNYRTYKDAYALRMDGDSLTLDQFVDEYSSSDIKTLKDYYRKNLDLSIILTAVWYSLNIVDAAVDAHLFEFDVSDNLSMRVEPVIQYQSRSNNFTGVKLQFALKN
jgi:heme oxygenase